MECPCNVEERAMFARLLPLLILFLMLLRSFGLHAVDEACDGRCVCPSVPNSLAVLEPFNEKTFWIDEDTDGNVIICSQRLLLNSFDFYQTRDIYCSRGIPIPIAKVLGAGKEDVCWKMGSGKALCEKVDGTLFQASLVETT